MYDLKTSENELSVYLIDEQGEGENPACLALAATRNALNNLDYILFRPSIVENLGLVAKETPGEVPDQDVASQHRDIVVITACNLARLANRIWDSDELVRGRLTKREVEEGIRKGVTNGKLDPNNVKFDKNLLGKLGI